MNGWENRATHTTRQPLAGMERAEEAAHGKWPTTRRPRERGATDVFSGILSSRAGGGRVEGEKLAAACRADDICATRNMRTTAYSISSGRLCCWGKTGDGPTTDVSGGQDGVFCGEDSQGERRAAARRSSSCTRRERLEWCSETRLRCAGCARNMAQVMVGSFSSFLVTADRDCSAVESRCILISVSNIYRPNKTISLSWSRSSGVVEDRLGTSLNGTLKTVHALWYMAALYRAHIATSSGTRRRVQTRLGLSSGHIPGGSQPHTFSAQQTTSPINTDFCLLQRPSLLFSCPCLAVALPLVTIHAGEIFSLFTSFCPLRSALRPSVQLFLFGFM
jgi:hypothetical protein